MVPELLVLVRTLHEHAGVGATLALVRGHFYWPAIARDTRLYVASCGCNRRKRSRIQKIATIPGRAVEPWETLQVDILFIGTTCRKGSKYVLLEVDRASRFPFGFLLPLKGTKEVARILANLFLTFGSLKTSVATARRFSVRYTEIPLPMAESQTRLQTRRSLPRSGRGREVWGVSPRDAG